MPIYEYSCEKCGHQTEIMHRISDPTVTECPACHEQTLVKQVSAAGFRLKGGGWYETDFKSSGKRNVAGDGSDGASTAGAGDKSEAKSHSCATGGCGCAPKTSNSTSDTSSSPPASSSANPSAT